MSTTHKLTCRYCIVTSRVDPASDTVLKKLIEISKLRNTGTYLFGNEVYKDPDERFYVISVSDDLLYVDYLENYIVTQLFIFVSRHESASRRPSLLTHVPGNWTDEARYGGRPRSVCIAPPSNMLEALRTLHNLSREFGLEDWSVSYEATHHGPYLEATPVMFIEIGSSEEEWRNEKAAEVLVHAIEAAIEAKQVKHVAVGIGGPHYAPKFTSIALREEIAFGHIVPEYVLEGISSNEIVMAVKRCSEVVTEIIFDWKGIKGGLRKRLYEIANELGKVHGFTVIKR